MQEIKRINKIRRRLLKDSNTKEVSKAKKGPMKTLLVRVMTPDLKERLERLRKKPETIPQPISNTSRENLNKLLVDYTRMKEAILNVYWEEFKKDPVGLMSRVARPSSRNINQSKLISDIDEDERPTSSGFACSLCGQPLYVYKLEQLNDKGNPHTNHFGRCNLPQHKRLILLAPQKPAEDDESVTYSLGKFGQRALDFYSIHITKDSNHPVKPLEQIGGDYYASGPVGKALSDACMGAVASFLTKYQDIILEHQKVVKENKKKLVNLKNIASANGLVFPEITLLPQPHTKEGIEAYNDVVAQIMIWVNLNLWQKLKIGRDEAKPLQRLKGFPSFPVVERHENKVDWWGTVNEFKKLLSEKKEVGKTFWCGLSKEKKQEVLLPYLPAAEDRKKEKKYARYQLGDMLLHLEKKNSEDWRKVYDEVWERMDKKITMLIEHIKREENKKSEDAQSKAALTDWVRAMASFVIEGLKETDEEEFRGCEIKLQKWYGDLRGRPFAVATENRVVDISGFSIGSDGKSIQYRSILAWKYKENGNREFYLLLNYGKEGKIKFEDTKRAKGNNTWQGLLYAKGNAKIVDLKFDPNDEQLIIMPLAFGKRQGREFIWNNLLSLETGLLKLANGRVIEKTLYNRKTGQDEPALFVALTFERREVLDSSNIKPMNLIGIDRGENIPAVIALTDPEGCPLLRFRDTSGNPTHILRIGEGYKGKQRTIQAAKEVEQRRAGGYSRKYASKAKNLADDMVRNAARDLFYHAVIQDAVLVFENLARGFGRQGKRTFMTERQYTKMEDWLMEKLAYEGLPYKTYLTKTIARYTSKTCSNCGFVITNADYDMMLDGIKKATDGWVTALNGKELKAEGQITYYNRYKRQNVTKDLSVELDRLWGESGNKDIHGWTKGRREEALFLLKKRFSHRPVQEKFICLDCGFETHADEQAALNIARSRLFLSSQEYEKYQSGKKAGDNNNRAFVEAWQSFYRRKLKEVWKPVV